MGPIIKGLLKMEKKMELVYINGQMILFIKETGEKIELKDM